MVLDEPVVAIGQASGQPRFTAGEGFKPEIIDIRPIEQFQTGGQVKLGGFTPQVDQMTMADAIRAKMRVDPVYAREFAQRANLPLNRQQKTAPSTVPFGTTGGRALPGFAPPR
jgi:hypothetical protein